MRKVIILAQILSAAILFSQSSMALGDNLHSYLDSYPPKYKTVGSAIMPIAEGVIDYYKYKATTTDEDVKILIVLDSFPIGILQSSKGKSQILLDMNGDGRLDSEMPFLWVPTWVIAANTPAENKTSTDNITPYLDILYAIFQSNENPYQQNGALSKCLSKMLADLKDHRMPNRDVLYSLFEYYEISQASPMAAMGSLQYLTNQCLGRFRKDHALMYLATLETLLNLGEIQRARDILKDLLSGDSKFIPGQVYQWQLEQDPAKKKEYYERLKKEHGDHWIVKQI